MTRAEVEAAFEVSEGGVIKSLGKFEAEMLYVPAMWNNCMHGFYDFDCAGVLGVVFDDADRKEFPEIADAYGIFMEESDNGFVNTREFTCKSDYDAAVEAIEQASNFEDSEEL